MTPRRPRKRPHADIDKLRSIRLDVGCGRRKQPGFVGMDIRPWPGVDIVHDLEDTPWPLPDNSCSIVVMSHVFEHVSPKRTLDVMAEIHRVCQPDAQVAMSGPYGVGYRWQQDPTHCNPIVEATLYYFDPLKGGLWDVYQPPPLHVEQFMVVPAPMYDRDFEALLRVCKPGKGGKCQHAK